MLHSFQVDFNVPIDGGRITNTQRIDAAMPTIKYALDQVKMSTREGEELFVFSTA